MSLMGNRGIGLSTQTMMKVEVQRRKKLWQRIALRCQVMDIDVLFTV